VAGLWITAPAGRSLIPLQLSLSPMGVLAVGIELPHDVAVQGFHDADLCHQGIAAAAAESGSRQVGFNNLYLS
jgi:hypothetical protein